MTRRELFRRYAAEHFTAPDGSADGRARCRGRVERQTSRARLASLARIAPRYPVPTASGAAPGRRRGPEPLPADGPAVRIPQQRSYGDGPTSPAG
ncbi:hypothetical protein ACFY00_35835 [Kitasatospora sp. NPDC001540]|uniref:hypothetical protein n=1 Tax=Kitasatospora sp. NPDC001540 TaxID=3364014 RepID=UPI0036990DB3